MIAEGTRQVDLYDLISIFIPGAALLVGIVPLLPQNSPISTTSFVAGVIIGGFVVGRGVHAGRLWMEKYAGATSHRDKFIYEIFDSGQLSDELLDQFYVACTKQFEMSNLPSSRQDLDFSNHADDVETLYTMARSYIHIDARGRSRSFQAVYDFYGSIWIVSFVLVLIYWTYAVLKAFSGLDQGVVGYESYLATFDIHPAIIFFGAGTVLGFAYATFRRVRGKYRDFYIEYFMSDFVTLQKVNK